MTAHTVQHLADVALGMASGVSFMSAIHRWRWWVAVQGVFFLIIACLPW